MNTIVLTGGGTAGHCIPHLAILPYLKKEFKNIYYIGSENGIERKIIEQQNIPYFYVPCAKLVRQFTLDNLLIPFKVISGIKKAEKLLKELNPDVIFSKGGYVSIPTVIAGKKLKIPVVAHESDYTVGLTNKVTSRYCKKVLTSFPDTALTIKNGEYSGPPIREELFNVNKDSALSYFGFKGKKPVLLVTGGSLGAKPINDTLRKALPVILKDFDVLHICGKNNLDNSISKKGYVQLEFVKDMQHAFAVADLCISRAGSNTVFEIIALKIPNILIPLPKGVSRGDQILNANYFEKLNLSNVLTQEQLTVDSLCNLVKETYNNKAKFLSAFRKSKIKNQSKNIAQKIIEIAKQR